MPRKTTAFQDTPTLFHSELVPDELSRALESFRFSGQLTSRAKVPSSATATAAIGIFGVVTARQITRYLCWPVAWAIDLGSARRRLRRALVSGGSVIVFASTRVPLQGLRLG